MAGRSSPRSSRRRSPATSSTAVEQALVEALDADVFVLAGPRVELTFPPDTYRRLAADVAAVQPNLVADLSGAALTEALTPGVIRVLKVSDEELERAGLAEGAGATAAPGGHGRHPRAGRG